MKTGLSVIILLFIISSYGFAQDQDGGFEVLGIAPTPFSLSKAEATTSVPDGAASIYTNPALLALTKTSSIDLGYSFWVANITNVFGGVNFRNDKRAVALAFYTSGASDYEQRDRPGPSNGDFSIQHISISGAYAYDFGLFALGGAFQYLNEQNYTYRASGYAFNAGIARNFMNNRIRTGASINNAGEMGKLNVSATPLPTNFKVGVSADILEFLPPKNSDLPVLISTYLDYFHPLEDVKDKDYTDYNASEPYLNLGLGFEIAEVVQLSGGYKFQLEDIADRDFSGHTVRPISFGAAFITSDLIFNYAIIPFNTGYGTVHSIGIQYKF